jgi:hypothetical protein
MQTKYSKRQASRLARCAGAGRGAGGALRRCRGAAAGRRRRGEAACARQRPPQLPRLPPLRAEQEAAEVSVILGAFKLVMTIVAVLTVDKVRRAAVRVRRRAAPTHRGAPR